ncbi:MAG: NAD(P) transhydrogenase subunit alpha [Bacteroidetes bacterium]|jgi:NAD(P) transhydrogenase subunit alpha|nr:NAD(P) transhydrogenase subunit alpha [Bacteroidota bacterium]
MKVGIVKESRDPRVAIVPDTLSKLSALGVSVIMEAGAGDESFFSDNDYVGATVLSRDEVLKQADIIVTFNPLSQEEWKLVNQNAIMISQFAPFADAEAVPNLLKEGKKAFSMDMIPRTTLAQSMDVLSSMASIAGYQAVLVAAAKLPRYLPMLITAAGSIKPSKVLILGAGVAGLQAIATAKRLGAIVEVFDTRMAVKEEVQSLGGKFIEVEGAKDDKSAGGYAVEQTEEFLARQRAEVQARAVKSDIIITTAQVRGRKAPILLEKETVNQMRAGSVIIDLASSTGGNCELSKDNETIVVNGVTIIGNSQLAAQMPQDASFLYSNNVLNFLKTMVREGTLHADFNNEIIKGACITPELFA